MSNQVNEFDFNLARSQSLVGLTPLSSVARQWMGGNVSAEPWQYRGATLWIDGRVAGAIVEGIQEAGLTIENL